MNFGLAGGGLGGGGVLFGAGAAGGAAGGLGLGLAGLGGAAGGVVAAGGPGFVTAGQAPPEGLSPPSALKLIHLNAATDPLLAGEGLGNDDEAEREVRRELTTLRHELRRADPTAVQPRTPERYQKLFNWLREEGPDGAVKRAGPAPGLQQPAEWDEDTPDDIKEQNERQISKGMGVTRDWSFNQVKRLADELQLDDSRCLELLCKVGKDQAMRRDLEERRELPSGTLDQNDYDPHLAAVELFYLEREALTGLLQNLFIGAINVRDDLKRDELRELLFEQLLEEDTTRESLTTAIPAVLAKLTSELAKLNHMDGRPEPRSAASVRRRRKHLRTQRLKLAEVLVFLYQSFRPTAKGVGAIIRATRDLAQGEGFVRLSREGSSALDDGDESDDWDDRAGILRTIVLLQLSLVHAMDGSDGGKHGSRGFHGARVFETFAAELRMAEDGKLRTAVEWRGNMPEPEFYAFLEKRMRASAPDAYRIQGFNALILVAYAAPPELPVRKRFELFRQSMHHFACSWFTDVILSLCRLDACNCSDFRSRPEQMILQRYVYKALGSLLVNLFKPVFDPEEGYAPPKLSEYELGEAQHLDSDVGFIKQQDCLEQVVAMYGEFVVLYGEFGVLCTEQGDEDYIEEVRKSIVDILHEYRITSDHILNTATHDQDLGAVQDRDDYYIAHGRLLEAVVLSAPQHSFDDDDGLLGDLDGLLNSEDAYYRYWIYRDNDDPMVFRDKDNREIFFSLVDVGTFFERYDESSFDHNRKWINSSLLSVWISCLEIVQRVLETFEEGKARIVDEMFAANVLQPNEVALVKSIFWLCHAEKDFAADDPQTQSLLPKFYGACFKVLAAFAARETTRDGLSNVETIWNLMTEQRSLYSDDPSALSKLQPPLFAKTLRADGAGLAKDGLLCLLGILLPAVAAESPPSLDSGGQSFASFSGAGEQGVGVGSSGAYQQDWIMWVCGIIQNQCPQRLRNEEDPNPVRWKLLSRALQIFLGVLKVSSQGDASQSPAGTIMSEMLSRAVLLPYVLSLIYDPAEVLDAARALDEFSASESRKAANRLLNTRAPLQATSGSIGLPSPTHFPIDTWGWWRQRSVMLALAVLSAVAKREGEFIETWYTATRKQVSVGALKVLIATHSVLVLCNTHIFCLACARCIPGSSWA